jgi:DNA-binding response OmpR family regulator
MRALNMARPQSRMILLVDDNANFTAALARLLHTAGYGVQIARDEASAKEHLEAGMPDLMIVDIHLEEENGLEVAQRFCARCGETIPILVLTSDSGIETLADFRRAGAMTYLHKNVASAVILGSVAQAIERAEKGRRGGAGVG